MAQIIIGPTSTSNVTGAGLSVTSGLSFGIGLILGFSGFTGIAFSGGGALTPSTLATTRIAATLPGAGALSALPSGRYTTNPAALAGAGLFTDVATLVTVYKQAAATLPATSTLLGNAVFGRSLISAKFDGSGSLVPTVRLALQATVGFSGTGGKQGA